MFRRRILLDDAMRAAIATADAVAVNSFPFDNRREVDALVDALSRAAGLVVVDPNPRPNLMADMTAYRGGAERAIAAAGMVKLSDQDAALLYGCAPREVADRLVAAGIDTVFSQAAAARASSPGAASACPCRSRAATGRSSTRWAPAMRTLATVLRFIMVDGMPATHEAWMTCLSEAMRVAAATCASAGGSLMRPHPD